MSLPDGFLDELRTRTPIAPLIGRRVRLVRSGREHKGCCPFHHEKTPSFYVYDDHFHCFGCGAHGDAISFVMQSEALTFSEAVERLAAEAGLEMPLPTPNAAVAARHEAGLIETLEAACREYQQYLNAPGGARARAYLRERGLTDMDIERFGLGWSGEGRGALLASLRRQGITMDQLVAAGLMKPNDHGAVDYFYGRLMFPICSRRGQIISFGGRLLGSGEPKYLNGPETPVFSKRRTLYGLDLAREAMRAGSKLVVAEGYMDVIALHSAGLAGGVAPLGTALTEAQLAELWRLSPMPILCFDGDAAGRRATLRAIELSLPYLSADRSLSVACLPDSEDPDSLIRNGRKSEMVAILDAARPLAVALFDLLAEGVDRTSPEGRASFLHRLDDAVSRISDRALAREYRTELRDRFYVDRGIKRIGPGFPAGRRRVVVSARPAIDAAATARRRAELLIAVLLHHVDLLPVLAEDFAALPIVGDMDTVRAIMLDWLHREHDCGTGLDSGALLNHFRQSGLDGVIARILAQPLPSVIRDAEATRSDLETFWYGIVSLMNLGWLREQCAEQQRRWQDTQDAATWKRLVSITLALRRAERGEIEEDESA